MIDAEAIAACEPLTRVGGSGRVNPLLDLPLKQYAGMDKTKLWEMFVWRLAEGEARWILRDEQSSGPPMRSTMDAANTATCVRGGSRRRLCGSVGVVEREPGAAAAPRETSTPAHRVPSPTK